MQRFTFWSSVLTAVFIVNGLGMAQSPPAYIGLRFPPMPPECKNIGSHIVSESRKDLGIIHNVCSGAHVIWLTGLTHRDAAKTPRTQVLDAVVLPKLKEGQTIVWFDCEFRDVQDISIYAIGTWKQGKVGGHLSNITYATRPNIATLKFEKLPLHLVRCWYEDDRD